MIEDLLSAEDKKVIQSARNKYILMSILVLVIGLSSFIWIKEWIVQLIIMIFILIGILHLKMTYNKIVGTIYRHKLHQKYLNEQYKI